ncbi:calmodulin-binding protein 60 D-like [Eucalyptus grandis]|uniref:calmodulin-binding protein 60 D-like n=1 Tax=Eucalyptus grandis TaxID=71139 RepID=UPI00192ED4AC|nr:calmodulin-binding protein 60 D-like [Eucalyptus grandis]
MLDGLSLFVISFSIFPVSISNGCFLERMRANANSTGRNDVRNLQLQLRTNVTSSIYANKLEGDGGGDIYVDLIDANTREVVTSGPESSIKLDVVVLEGDFNKDDEDNWTQEEFENRMVKQREGKRPLLIGDLLVTLKGGVGKLGNLMFTDNSSWNRSKSFRIGLKVASGYCGNARIQQAKTEAFVVREHRGESYKKHYPPASDDDIWRLEKIAKDGKLHKKLCEAGIHKVEDFLLQLFIDSEKLRKILGKSIIPKKWDMLVDHAKTCKIDQKLYLYYSDGMRKHGAVFNTNKQLIGLIKDMVYFATHQLTAQEKEHGDTIVKKALANLSDVYEFSGETFSGSMQKKSSTSFPSQVYEGQIENLTPVQGSMAAAIFPAPVNLEAPLTNGGVTAEGQYSSATASTLSGQSQNPNFGNAMGCPIDENAPPAACQPIFADRSNGLFSPGNNGITTCGLPTQSPDIISQDAMRSQMTDSSSHMDCRVTENVLPSEPPCASTSSFPSSSSLAHLEGNHATKDFHTNVSNDNLWSSWPDYAPDEDAYIKLFVSV